MSGREEVHLSMEVPPSMAHDPWEEAFVSAADTNAEETLNTLKPANQAHEIQIIDVELMECYLSMIQNLENEVRQLEAALRTTGEESREVEEDEKVTKQTCLQDAMGKQLQDLEQNEILPVNVKVHWQCSSFGELVFILGHDHDSQYDFRVELCRFSLSMSRSAGSVATLVNWFSSWVMTMTVNMILEWNSAGTFVLYALICALTLVFIASHVPEKVRRVE